MANREMPNGHKIGNKWRKGLRPANAFKKGNVPANKTEEVAFDCAQCGKLFSVLPWVLRSAPSKSGRRFCSNPCHADYKREKQSGKNAPDYVGGVTTYRGKGWGEARTAAIKRDGGECQRCTKFVGDGISVHHIIPYRNFDSTKAANVQSNLVCLCQSCHMIVERETDKGRPFIRNFPNSV